MFVALLAGRADAARPLFVEAIAARRAAAASSDASPADLNACAQLLLKADLKDLRNRKDALTLALRANELTKAADPDVLRTVARAVESQRRALERLSENDPERVNYQKELADYRSATGN